MNDPWFDENLYSWIPGTAFGVLVGLWGTLAGCLAPMGRARGLVMGFGWSLVLVGVCLLAAAAAAGLAGQPYGVWFSLLLPGILGVLLMPPLMLVIRTRYREAELRKVSAMDIE